jgi:hypothetical protein
LTLENRMAIAKVIEIIATGRVTLLLKGGIGK